MGIPMQISDACVQNEKGSWACPKALGILSIFPISLIVNVLFMKVPPRAAMPVKRNWPKLHLVVLAGEDAACRLPGFLGLSV